MRDPTRDEVQAFYRAMQARYGFRLVDKREDGGIRALANVLAPAIPVHDFVNRYATSLGDAIYVPFLPGEVSALWSPWAQVRIVVHEVVHVEQHRADPLFQARYLLSPPHRAIYEAQAIAAGWQFDHARGVPHPPPLEQVLLLRGYVLSEEARATAVAVLESAEATIMAGGIVSGVAAFAIAALPLELRAVVERMPG